MYLMQVYWWCILRKRPLVGLKSINSDSLGPKKTARDRLIEVIFTEIKANDFCHVYEWRNLSLRISTEGTATKLSET